MTEASPYIKKLKKNAPAFIDMVTEKIRRIKQSTILPFKVEQQQRRADGSKPRVVCGIKWATGVHSVRTESKKQRVDWDECD
jgi:hypothetical protein